MRSAARLLAFAVLLSNSAIHAAHDDTNAAFPDTFMLRLGAYQVENADTDMTILSDDNV